MTIITANFKNIGKQKCRTMDKWKGEEIQFFLEQTILELIQYFSTTSNEDDIIDCRLFYFLGDSVKTLISIKISNLQLILYRAFCNKHKGLPPIFNSYGKHNGKVCRLVNQQNGIWNFDNKMVPRSEGTQQTPQL